MTHCFHQQSHLLATALYTAVLQEHAVDDVVPGVMSLLIQDASPCADTVRMIPNAGRTKGGQLQSDILHQLGHSYGTALHFNFAATRSFARHNTQMLHVLGLCDGCHTCALTLI